MDVCQLDDDIWFPDPYSAEEDGLLAEGGDLSVERLLLAYSKGIFPYFSFDFDDKPLWYCPLDRFVIFPKEIHISHSMKQLLKQNKYEVTFNECFNAVIEGCSKADFRNLELGAWLREDMINAYKKLHKQGYATSVEVWEKNSENPSERKLVGGLYGVTICNSFFGESMFSLVPNASKLALITLANYLKDNGGVLIDCQFETPHLLTMGGRHISYEEYIKLINGGGI